MKITQTSLKGCFIVEPVVYKDERGYFFESYNHKKFVEATGLDMVFLQDNQAKSQYGVIRGLHLQRVPSLQAKFVRVLEGRILDVAVDVRYKSPTYGQHFSIELTSDNNLQLFIPHGFAHGYSVLSDSAVVAYKCDTLYDKDSEDGINLYDKELNIDWRIPEDKAILSEKDKVQLAFSSFQAIKI